jgi:uncharacterized protein
VSSKLISRHCAILGATGSGKSNAVSIVVKAIADKKFPSSRVLMIDPHGEYAGSLTGRCQVFRVGANSANDENELCVAFWALPFKELMAIFPGKLSDQNEDYIRGKVLELKRVSAVAIGGLRQEAITADSPIPFSIHKLWFELDDFERMTFKTDRTTPETLLAKGDPATLTSNHYPTAGLGSSAPFLNNKAIVSGEAVRIPSRIKFYQADNAVKSSDPIASKLWANASPDVAEYETSVRNWRNQSFTQGGDNANP